MLVCRTKLLPFRNFAFLRAFSVAIVMLLLLSMIPATGVFAEETDSGLDETGKGFVPRLLDQQKTNENEDTHEECGVGEEVSYQQNNNADSRTHGIIPPIIFI